MIRGRRLTDREFWTFINDEIDNARTLPDNFNEIICSFPFPIDINKAIDKIEIFKNNDSGGNQMKHLNIKDYVISEKERIKLFAKITGINNKIKLGIIDAISETDRNGAIYIGGELNDFDDVGWKAELYEVREDETSCHDAIIRAIEHGCTSVIVQLPIREGVDFDPIMIPRIYDCGGLRPDSWVNPIVPQGILDYLKACEFPFSGKTAVILGRGDTAGKPMAQLLLQEDMTVSICHNKSCDSIVSGFLCDADLVICTTGKSHAVVRSQCYNAVVIDAGTDYLEGKPVEIFEEKPQFCSDTVWSTPVPGGVDLLTRLALLKNCAALALKRKNGGPLGPVSLKNGRII